MINRDLTITITNEQEGITLTLKTVSALGPGKVSIMADPGVYDSKELEDALNAVKEFTTGSVIVYPQIHQLPGNQQFAYMEPTVGE